MMLSLVTFEQRDASQGPHMLLFTQHCVHCCLSTFSTQAVAGFTSLADQAGSQHVSLLCILCVQLCQAGQVKALRSLAVLYLSSPDIKMGCHWRFLVLLLPNLKRERACSVNTPKKDGGRTAWQFPVGKHRFVFPESLC